MSGLAQGLEKFNPKNSIPPHIQLDEVFVTLFQKHFGMSPSMMAYKLNHLEQLAIGMQGYLNEASPVIGAIGLKVEAMTSALDSKGILPSAEVNKSIAHLSDAHNKLRLGSN